MRFCYFLLLISLLASACETVVEIELPEEGNRIVVNGLVPSDSSWIMRITQSKDPLETVDFFTSIFTPIKNAEVVITDNEGNTINLTYSEDIPEFVDCEFENCDAYGYFVNPSAAKAGMNYTLQVNANGFPSVTSQFLIPEKVPIKSAEIGEVVTINTGDFSENEVDGNITFQDNPNERNFYTFEVYSIVAYTIDNVDPDTGEIISSDTITDYFQISVSSPDPSVVNSDADFATSFLLINDNLSNGSEYNLNFKIDYFNSQGFIYVFKHISEDYYNYLLSYENFQFTDGNPFAEPVQIASNVENGLGIIATYSSDTVSFEFD